MLRYLLVPMLALTLALPLRAATFKLAEDAPYVSFQIPDSWKPAPYDIGVEALSPDQEVYIAIETTDTAGVDKSIDDGLKYLKDKGVVVDEASVAKKELKINGMDVIDIAWTGKDQDGPCKISLSIVVVTKDKGLVLIYWASPEGETKNQDALTAIAKSLTPL